MRNFTIRSIASFFQGILLFIVFSFQILAVEPIPIFRGDYPDPTIVRVGEDYYLTHTSGYNLPGLFVYHSTNLIDWTLLGPAIEKSDIDLLIYAPDIVFHNNKFFIYFPAAGTNFVVWADKPEGPWSKPIDLKVPHIDPGHLVATDGKRYLYLSGGNVIELSPDGLSTVGKLKHVYDGWQIPADWQIECHCLESPKLFSRDGYYHMISAQGGTTGPPTGHMIVHARSKNPMGPWENSPHNPIIRATSRKENWGMRGHGTVFDDPNGNWWVIYHAYEKDFKTLGRQNCLEPLKWTEDGWLRVDEEPKRLQSLAKPQKRIPLEENFTGESLPMPWFFWHRTIVDPYMEFTRDGLVWKAQGQRIEETNPLLMKAADHSYEIQVDVEIDGQSEAGLLLFYDPKNYIGIKLTEHGYETGLRGELPRGRTTRSGVSRSILKIRNDENSVEFFISEDNGKTFTKIGTGLDVCGFHANTFGGYSSLKPGLSCTGEGRATFRNFRYTPLTND